jgi:hypothetical protein
LDIRSYIIQFKIKEQESDRLAHAALVDRAAFARTDATSSIAALLLYGRMVGLLGATTGAAFVALTPATTALFAGRIAPPTPRRVLSAQYALRERRRPPG